MDGWGGTETVHPNGKLEIPSICRLYAHQEENLNQNLLKMFDIFLTTYAVSTVVYTMQVPSKNILFIRTKQFTVVFFCRCRSWYVQAFLAQIIEPPFLSQLHCQPEKIQHVSIGAHKPSQLIVQNTSSNLCFLEPTWAVFFKESSPLGFGSACDVVGCEDLKQRWFLS